MTPDAWADFSSRWVRCPGCGTPSPALQTPDACLDWAESHACPPVTAEQASEHRALLEAELEAAGREAA